MKIRQTFAILFALLAITIAAAEDRPKPADAGTLVILDAAGKKQTLKAWKFTEGVRRLGWLAPAKTDKAPEDGTNEKKAPARGKRAGATGPEALAIRAETEIEYLEGVLTLIPLEHLQAIDFDNEMDVMTAQVGEGETAEKITGSTKYKRINKLVIEAEVDKGDLGIAEVKFVGGIPRGIRGVRFPAPKAAPPVPQGRRVLVVSSDGKNRTSQHKVVDLSPLYRLADGSEKLLPTLAFKKTLKLDLARIKKAVIGEGGWQVTMKDGGDETLTLLETLAVDGKQARLLGFVGRVPVGYKLFPASAIAEITFDAEESKDK